VLGTISRPGGRQLSLVPEFRRGHGALRARPIDEEAFAVPLTGTLPRCARSSQGPSALSASAQPGPGCVVPCAGIQARCPDRGGGGHGQGSVHLGRGDAAR